VLRPRRLAEPIQRAPVEVQGHSPAAYPVGTDVVLDCPIPHRRLVARLQPDQIEVDAGNLVESPKQPAQQRVAAGTIGPGEDEQPIARLEIGRLRLGLGDSRRIDQQLARIEPSTGLVIGTLERQHPGHVLAHRPGPGLGVASALGLVAGMDAQHLDR